MTPFFKVIGLKALSASLIPLSVCHYVCSAVAFLPMHTYLSAQSASWEQGRRRSAEKFRNDLLKSEADVLFEKYADKTVVISEYPPLCGPCEWVGIYSEVFTQTFAVYLSQWVRWAHRDAKLLTRLSNLIWWPVTLLALVMTLAGALAYPVIFGAVALADPTRFRRNRWAFWRGWLGHARANAKGFYRFVCAADVSEV